MAWRDVLARIVSQALDDIVKCEGEACAELLAGAAAAVYAPLAPIDAGSGQLKMMAARLAGILAHVYAYNVLGKAGGEANQDAIDTLKATADAIERVDAKAAGKKLLEKLGLGFEPVPSEEALRAVVHGLRYYIEAYEEALQARRRRRVARPPTQQDAIRHMRRLVREIGRIDPFLARSIANQLRAYNLPV